MPLMSYIVSVFRRGISSFIVVEPVPEVLPHDVLVDEETLPGYRSEIFYPAHPGDILDDRFELKAKLGWGSTSTVWLARDLYRRSVLDPKRYVALKICNCDASDESIHHELDIHLHIASADDEPHAGRRVLGTATDSFCVSSAEGTHLVLVFPPLREPLWLFRRRLCGQDRVTRPFLSLMKVYLRTLLEGLDYLHSRCQVVHTDLKLDNILVSLEDVSIIEHFARMQAAHPMARKYAGDRIVYRCRNDFGDFRGVEYLKRVFPVITDFGVAQRGDQPGPLLHPIQPDDSHAPEVLFGTGWSYSADIWNFGIMTWQLLAGHGPFHRGTAHPYSAVRHLAEMISLLGPPPPIVVQRERRMRPWRWKPEVPNAEGRASGSAAEFFGGPFFDDRGEFVRPDLITRPRHLRHERPECVPDEEADRFFTFMRRMLCWIPEQRPSAAVLKDDPWLND